MGQGAEDHVASGHFVDAGGLVDADAATEEEVDDALFEDAGGDFCFAGLGVDGVCGGFGGVAGFLGLSVAFPFAVRGLMAFFCR